MIIINNVEQLNALSSMPHALKIDDHLGGFDQDLNNAVLQKIQSHSLPNNPIHVHWHNIACLELKQRYSNLIFHYDLNWQIHGTLGKFVNYTQHPIINYENFLCSFNGSPHVSRKLLIACLGKFNFYNPDYCSKNFLLLQDELLGYINDYTGTQDRFYNKFFTDNKEQTFFKSINSFGHKRYAHEQNIFNLEQKLTQSFVHVVSETMATSYVPFVTEKFLYSVVTRGLWVGYAQPTWHQHLEKYYGFKLYKNLFDYRFDSMTNPIERLIELMTMLSKFSILSKLDWHDLYLVEHDTIEYNYDHYASGDYIKTLEMYAL